LGYGVLILDTGSTVNILTREHARPNTIKRLHTPIRIRGAAQGMASNIEEYFIHELFGFCLVADRVSILSYRMLLSMGWEVKQATPEHFLLKHPDVRRLKGGIKFRCSERDGLYLAFDPTKLRSWTPLEGNQRIGYLQTVINDDDEEAFHYRLSYDRGDDYYEPVAAVAIPVANAATVRGVVSVSDSSTDDDPVEGRPSLSEERRTTDEH
jgi:hypothetical protein